VKTADGSSREMEAETILINTGARPALPPVRGLDSVDYLDSTSIMELGEVPEHLLVMGGGYIGLEFGQMFARFGAQVTIVNRGPQLAAREDPDVAEEIGKILAEDGVDVVLNASATEVSQDGAGKITVTMDQQGTSRSFTGSHLLVATGRTPNTDTLGLENTELKSDKRGFIRVNDRLETGVDGVYAIGDCKGGPAFTHISYADFRIVNENLFGAGNASISGRLVPYTMFIDPQLGRVGMSEKEAEAANIDFDVKKMPMEWVARALEVDEARGMMKAIIDKKTERILGFTCLGLEGGEIMGAVQIAMMGDLPYTALRDGTFAHPTIIESLNNLFSL
jgi:pyruvate/2-oxoglutarate dehydrogenase complex dihydrolipoamide dehydrogenase (E3) component